MKVKLKKEYLNYVIKSLMDYGNIGGAESLTELSNDDNFIKDLDPHSLTKSSKYLTFSDWIVERRKNIIDNI